MINSHEVIYVERKGVIERVESPFDSPDRLERLFSRMGGLCGTGAPTLENPEIAGRFMWPDREDPNAIPVRVEMVHSLLNSNGHFSASLRKPVATPFDKLETWTREEFGQPLSPAAAQFLAEAIEHRANIVVVGGTGSGKTTLTKALIDRIPHADRILVAEESAELSIKRDTVVALMANERMNIGGLVRIAMRSRPDRIIVGECRGPDEVMGFLEAINTGHDGSITTVHANSAFDGLNRFIQLAGRDATNKISPEYIGDLITNNVDLIVYAGTANDHVIDPATGERVAKRIRRIMEIAYINGYDVRDGRIDFRVGHLFARLQRGTLPSQRAFDIRQPLHCVGNALGDTGVRFRKKLIGNGMSEQRLAELLRIDYRPEED